ncbi:MAG TPA: response regulator transcription factor [Candidatus Gastranaerophilales bacterium]|nr:response regulator transcription factor [Candidatus Gastranaerophilales bacterium]
MSRILVVDDDLAILELLKINLEMMGHEVITTPEGIKGFALVKQELPDLVLLDVMMPEVDGYTVAQRIRQNETTKDIPILMLTALGMLKDKVQGFNSGVDDYLVKPFELEELKVRVRALLRRSDSLPETLKRPQILVIGDITLLPENLSVKINDNEIKFTPIEFEILNCLAQNHGQTVASGTLLKEVWGYSQDDDVETIRVHIRHLRSKLEKAISDKIYIETIYGGGYKLIPEGVNKPVKK